MKEYFVIGILALLSLNFYSCDKIEDILLEESDDMLYCDYSVELYKPKSNPDCVYTLSAKFSDLDLFNKETMKVGFYIQEYDYTPHNGTYTPGPSIESDWILNDTIHYKWVDEIAENGMFSYSFLPVNKQYFCKACVLEELGDGTMMLVQSKPFMFQGNVQMSIALKDTLCNGFALDINRNQIQKNIKEMGFCWSPSGTPLIQDHRQIGAYTTFRNFDFGDCDRIYIRGYILFEDGVVNYSSVMEYNPKDFVVHIYDREDILKIKGDDNEQTIRDISMFKGHMIFHVDMLPKDKDAFATPLNCKVEGNGHKIYISSVGEYGHVDNAIIGYCYQWDMRNHGKMTNCYFESSTHVFNEVKGYIGQSRGWVRQNRGIIEDCEGLTVSTNQGVVKDCLNPFYHDPENPSWFGYTYIVQTNGKFGIIQNCRVNEGFRVCMYNEGVIQ